MTQILTTTAANTKASEALRVQVLEILAVIDAFAGLLRRETEALRKADFNAVDLLQADKRLYAKQYEVKVAALATRQNEFPFLELSLRERLMQERTLFSAVLRENLRALELAHNSTKRLVDRILEAARTAVVEDTHPNYSRGALPSTYKSASSSLTIDQRL